MRRIYADYAATTPLLPHVHEAMRPWLSGEYGNPSSLYEEGRRARAAIDESREVLSARLGCLFAEVLFTSSGTESANLALLGSAIAALSESPPRKRNRVLFSASEHHCVLHTQKTLELLGFEVQHVPVDRSAIVDVDALKTMMGEDVLLVSAMHANNEVGTIQPIFQVAEIAHRFGAWVHCDAVQTFTVWDWKVTDLCADLVSLSAHKVGGPKGAGAIFIKAGVKVHPLLVGGGQEREMRAGTENVAAIVGFAAASRKDPGGPPQPDPPRAFAAASAFRRALEGATMTIAPTAPTLPGHVHVLFPGVDAETLLIRLDRMGVSASAGAACSSGSLDPSHVLLACGYTEAEAKSGLRFTFGRLQTPEEGIEAAARVNEAVRQMRISR